MKDFLIIGKKKCSLGLEGMWAPLITDEIQWAEDFDPTVQYTHRKILFLVDLNAIGYDVDIIEHLNGLWNHAGSEALNNSAAGIFIHSPCDLYTKREAQNIIFLANQMGCRFPGHPIIESIPGLKNFLTWQKIHETSLESIRNMHCQKLFSRLATYEAPKLEHPKILALHASSNATSNTLMLWNEIAQHLSEFTVQTKHIENGSVIDCKGCDYKTCIHYGRQKSCFYGGVVIQELLGAIENADVIVWISPNYNDAISAMHTALINRLTVLYRRMPLYGKRIYSVIVSGNSGSDSVACQLIGALNINKGFDLPPHFSIMKIANDPGSIRKKDSFVETAQHFAMHMIEEIKKK